MPTELTFPEDSQQGDLQCVDVDIIDDEAVENYEYFYVELSTDDADVQLLSYYQRRRISINDNDGKIYLIVDNNYYYNGPEDYYELLKELRPLDSSYTPAILTKINVIL